MIKCTTYGGKVGWFLRKHFSKYTSEAYLNLQYLLRYRLFRKYMIWFEVKASNGEVESPCLVSIETVNRCNSTCSFCPVNKNNDPRPLRRMSEELFRKIIADLAEINYSGYLNLYVNNEPLVDKDIEERYAYAKQHLPNAKMLIYTNGTLLTRERFLKLIPSIDKMIINNYSKTLKLHDNIRDLYEFIQQSPDLSKKDITIQIRYIDEILTNRAGNAPNKLGNKRRKVHKLCVMPYTDVTIYPDGTLGICCNDAFEQTNLGNISETSFKSLWESERYTKLRHILSHDREGYTFCKGCDFFDGGIRNQFMRDRLRGRGK